MKNIRIQEPKIKPEGIIKGQPQLEIKNLKIENPLTGSKENFRTGDFIKISADIQNLGSTGIDRAYLYVNGRSAESEYIPIIKSNKSKVNFNYLLTEPGNYRFSINNTNEKNILVGGSLISFLYDSISVSSHIIPVGDELIIDAVVINKSDSNKSVVAKLYLNNKVVDQQKLHFDEKNHDSVSFRIILEANNY